MTTRYHFEPLMDSAKPCTIEVDDDGQLLNVEGDVSKARIMFYARRGVDKLVSATMYTHKSSKVE